MDAATLVVRQERPPRAEPGPERGALLGCVDADRHEPGVGDLSLVLKLQELAEVGLLLGAPPPPVEVQQHRIATGEVGQAPLVPDVIREPEVGQVSAGYEIRVHGRVQSPPPLGSLQADVVGRHRSRLRPPPAPHDQRRGDDPHGGEDGQQPAPVVLGQDRRVAAVGAVALHERNATGRRRRCRSAQPGWEHGSGPARRVRRTNRRRARTARARSRGRRWTTAGAGPSRADRWPWAGRR